MKRGIMYSTARREGCNVLVLGQHLDDLAESFVMSSFLNGNQLAYLLLFSFFPFPFPFNKIRKEKKVHQITLFLK